MADKYLLHFDYRVEYSEIIDYYNSRFYKLLYNI